VEIDPLPIAASPMPAASPSLGSEYMQVGPMKVAHAQQQHTVSKVA
jgi:hypothetical protein